MPGHSKHGVVRRAPQEVIVMPPPSSIASAGVKLPPPVHPLIVMLNGGYRETHGYNWFSGL